MLREQTKAHIADWLRRARDLQRDWADEQPVELVQTHISAVLLGRERVLKLKKPVDFGFLDYSTLEKRHLACLDEVRLNRRLAPDTYLGVEEIHEAQGKAHVGGPGELVDYGVLMKRLPAERMLDALLAQDRVTESLIRRIAERLAEFHAASPRTAEIEHWGEWEQIQSQWQENFEQTRPYIGRSVDETTFDEVEHRVRRQLQSLRLLFERRVRERRIVDGHGDLRCESVNVSEDGDEPIVFFDCIEFSSRLRCGDAASEIGFLAMDLAARGRPDLAYVLTEHYARSANDPDMARLLPFYCCYRAWVRGKVLSFRLDEPEFSDAQKRADTARAWGFFAQALQYTRRLETPALIAITGLSGTGKTTLGRAIGHALGLPVISADQVRHDLFGERKQPAQFGEGIYSTENTARTYHELLRRAQDGIQHGSAVIVDGTFLWPEQRGKAVEVAAAMGVPLRWIECVLSLEATRARIDRRQARGDSISDANTEVHRRQVEYYGRHRDSLPENRIVINTAQPLAVSVRQASDAVLSSE